MNNSYIRIEVQDGEIENILHQLHEAQETIYQCYTKLQEAGVLVISKEEKPSAATDSF